jgi:hypothetical protein
MAIGFILTWIALRERPEVDLAKETIFAADVHRYTQVFAAAAQHGRQKIVAGLDPSILMAGNNADRRLGQSRPQ